MRIRVKGSISDDYAADISLSLRAKGVLSVLIKCSNLDSVTLKDLSSFSNDSTYSFEMGINELIECHYLVKHNYYSNRWEYILRCSK
ncbi:hypothetical protein DY123_07505 [Apilactobacillus micheneri]|uniref:hypothetical protein n=1 Tax=Apilactobacillus micheneri TaxID=1899430 RepID=UPI00112E02B8|nr:hypothetical protein [Apilactobacillus micheneri]TPR41209.1 hypothetical protein DY123_07505 [Apilactobacillus micheneri]